MPHLQSSSVTCPMHRSELVLHDFHSIHTWSILDHRFQFPHFTIPDCIMDARVLSITSCWKKAKAVLFILGTFRTVRLILNSQHTGWTYIASNTLIKGECVYKRTNKIFLLWAVYVADPRKGSAMQIRSQWHHKDMRILWKMKNATWCWQWRKIAHKLWSLIISSGAIPNPITHQRLLAPLCFCLPWQLNWYHGDLSIHAGKTDRWAFGRNGLGPLDKERGGTGRPVWLPWQRDRYQDCPSLAGEDRVCWNGQ